MKTITITLAALVLASCGIESMDAAATTPATPAPTEAPVATTAPTTPPTTAAPTTQPPAPPAPPAQTTVLDCPGVDIDATSSLIPDDWDEWCDGYLFAVEWATSVDPTVCDGFWETDDQDIIDVFMAEGSTFSESVGMVDALWVVC